MDQALDTIERLVALNSADADEAANQITMVAVPGILKSIRDRSVGPARDSFVAELEQRIATRLSEIGKAHGMTIDMATVHESEISTDPKDWMIAENGATAKAGG
ncbi:hypothetical protein [Brevundimonas sp. NPDC058933]|uniref:hypothetical protein n=1 Tax=Brevundimonas sp. NPDC058933 TaxID=3346673 RepID=UPI003BEEDF60